MADIDGKTPPGWGLAADLHNAAVWVLLMVISLPLAAFIALLINAAWLGMSWLVGRL